MSKVIVPEHIAKAVEKENLQKAEKIEKENKRRQKTRSG